jgi:hypothetical protein
LFLRLVISIKEDYGKCTRPRSIRRWFCSLTRDQINSVAYARIPRGPMVPMKRYESAGTRKKVLRTESDVDQSDMNDRDAMILVEKTGAGRLGCWIIRHNLHD